MPRTLLDALREKWDEEPDIRDILDGAYERVPLKNGDYVLMNGGRFFHKDTLEPIPVSKMREVA